MKFLQLIEAVRENNDMNKGSWKDWEDAKHIQEVYGSLSEGCKKLNDLAEIFLNALIRNEGHEIGTLVEAFDIISDGVVYARPGINT